MNRLFLAFCFVTFYLLAGCQKVETVTPVDEIVYSEIPIEFSTGNTGEMVLETKGATPVTTDGSNNTSKLTSIYVSATTGSASESIVSSFSNITFSLQGTATGTNSTWTGGKYWPVSNPNYHFYASNISLSSNGQSVSPTNANTDVVVGRLASPTFQMKNQFQLEHIFAQLGTVVINAPSGYDIQNLKVTVQPIVGGTYNIKSGQWSSKSTAQSAVYVIGTASSGVNISAGGQTSSGDKDIWLVPGNYTFTATYTIKRDLYAPSTVWTKYATVELEKGRNNNITGSVPASGAAEIEFSVSVTNWSDNAVNNVTFGDNQ